MKVGVGSQVKFLNEDLKGEIKEILSNGNYIVVCGDGFDYEVRAKEVIIIGEDNQQVYTVDEKELNDKIKIAKTNVNLKDHSKGVLSKYLQKDKYQYERTVEIDLHLEELVEFPGKLDDWQKLHKQMTHVKNCLEAAFDHNIKKIVFIHGVGTGVLRTELRNYLTQFPNLIVRDADFREYGVGATEVLVKSN